MDYPVWKKEQEALGYIVNGLTTTKREDFETKEIIVEELVFEDIKAVSVVV